MRGFRLTRDMQIPKGAVKVADKESDAIAYLYSATHNGKPAAVFFAGKADKPWWRHYFMNEQQREQKIKDSFEARRTTNRWKDERKAQRAKPHTLKVGDILSGSWGYDQTNIDFFEVVATTTHTVTVRELKQKREENGWARGTCLPIPGAYKNEKATTHRCDAGNNIASPIHGCASMWDGKPENWTAYA